jgi:hypothetical protein
MRMSSFSQNFPGKTGCGDCESAEIKKLSAGGISLRTSQPLFHRIPGASGASASFFADDLLSRYFKSKNGPDFGIGAARVTQ